MISKIGDPARLFTEHHAEKEKYMHTLQKWKWGKNAEYFFPWQDSTPINLSNIIDDLKPKSVLDYGCGQGLTLKSLFEKFPDINFYNYDAFVDEYSTYPSATYDLIVSNNALQHIENQFYDQLVKNLYDLCNHTALFKLYTFENYNPVEWYIEKYSKFFKVDDITVGKPLITEPDKTEFLYGIKSYTKTPLYLKLSK